MLYVSYLSKSRTYIVHVWVFNQTFFTDEILVVIESVMNSLIILEKKINRFTDQKVEQESKGTEML